MVWNAAAKPAAETCVRGQIARPVRSGVVILDATLRPVALDTGGKAIFDVLQQSNGHNHEVPEAILSRLRLPLSQNGNAKAAHLSAGGSNYSWRTFVVTPLQGGDTVFTLYFRREASVMDGVTQIAAEYHLTDREREALIGLFMGLTADELAAQMKVSRNTVKAFVRLAMVKMGVSSRARLFSKLLDTQTG